MADETPRKGSFSALVGHTNGLTKPASLAAAAVTAKPGGAGGSKKLVIKNFRGGCGAGGRAGGALGRRPALRGRPVGAGRAGPGRARRDRSSRRGGVVTPSARPGPAAARPPSLWPVRSSRLSVLPTGGSFGQLPVLSRV